MPENINLYAKRSGRQVKENGEVINTAEMVEALYKSICINKDAGMQLSGSNVIQPTDIQSHLQQTIQTHNAVNVAASSNSISSYYDSDGFDRLQIIVKSDASFTTASAVQVIWSPDNGTTQFWENLGSATNPYKVFDIPTRSRYFSVFLGNSDTVAHTMSAYGYLKA